MDTQQQPPAPKKLTSSGAKWTTEEEDRLIDLVDEELDKRENGGNVQWTKNIAPYFPGRTPMACKDHYRALTNPSTNRGTSLPPASTSRAGPSRSETPFVRPSPYPLSSPSKSPPANTLNFFQSIHTLSRHYDMGGGDGECRDDGGSYSAVVAETSGSENEDLGAAAFEDHATKEKGVRNELKAGEGGDGAGGLEKQQQQQQQQSLQQQSKAWDEQLVSAADSAMRHLDDDFALSLSSDCSFILAPLCSVSASEAMSKEQVEMVLGLSSAFKAVMEKREAHYTEEKGKVEQVIERLSSWRRMRNPVTGEAVSEAAADTA